MWALRSETLTRSRVAGFCTVKDELQNRTSAPLHARIWWRAYDAAGVLLGIAFAAVYDVPADGQQVFESGPFYLGLTAKLVPCHRIARFEQYFVEVYDAHWPRSRASPDD